MEELELTNAMIERIDIIDNAVYDCICALAEKELEWNMQIIGEVTDVITDTLSCFKIRVRHPCIETNEDGTQSYGE